VKSARDTLRFLVAGCMFGLGYGSGASRFSHQRSEPTYGHASTEELPPAPAI
jgi:hypothetical protein